jgi:hypothetical protein
MKYLAVFLSVFFAQTAIAQTVIVPDDLMGRWEQDARNCTAPLDGDIPHIINENSSFANLALVFATRSGVPIMDEFSHESGEGLNCEIKSLLHSDPYRFSAKCSSRGMPMEPGVIVASRRPDAVSISFAGSELDSHGVITYHRCGQG